MTSSSSSLVLSSLLSYVLFVTLMSHFSLLTVSHYIEPCFFSDASSAIITLNYYYIFLHACILLPSSFFFFFF
jgi:hypothetical protein